MSNNHHTASITRNNTGENRGLVNRIAALALVGALSCVAQQPLGFDVGPAVVGPQRLETVYAIASGKWSDAGDKVEVNSTEIHCYKAFGFCEVASAANYTPGKASVNLTSFDILRWDTNEMIAVDSSPICLVTTLRFDFIAKKVSISATSKGETRDPFCKDLPASALATAFLVGFPPQPPEIKKK